MSGAKRAKHQVSVFTKYIKDTEKEAKGGND